MPESIVPLVLAVEREAGFRSGGGQVPKVLNGLVRGEDHLTLMWRALVDHMEQQVRGPGAVAETADFVCYVGTRASRRNRRSPGGSALCERVEGPPRGSVRGPSLDCCHSSGCPRSSSLPSPRIVHCSAEPKLAATDAASAERDLPAETDGNQVTNHIPAASPGWRWGRDRWGDVGPVWSTRCRYGHGS